MVEIRTFEGDAAEMASFTTAMWRKSYGGKMPMPLWTPEFLQWELMAGGEHARDYLVAAYDGAKLIGFLPAKPQAYRVAGRDVSGTMGSYLSVDPEYRRQGIALQMHQEQQRRHRERGATINMGYVYLGAAVAQGKKFWLKQPEGATIVAKIGLWTRLLDHKAVARFEISRVGDVCSRILGSWQPNPSPSGNTTGIRPYQASDLADCLRLVKPLSEENDFAYQWNETNLARQLQHNNVPKTLVLEQNGRVEGVISYCHLEMIGRQPLQVATIDLMAFGELSWRRQRDLVRAALRQMMADGIQLAVMLRIASSPSSVLFSSGFVPMPADYYYIGLVMEPGFPLTRAKRLHVHWR
ncbi:MAG: GNAT family N-acetyltransferase [Planctomycetes bacterium]|nr:GNAT family N-acetyltransferase [Planctomycetota bacterium]